MQRVRIGLTGLACVFLLVVLAASLFGLVGGDEAAMADGNATVVDAAGGPPREPLAELGVTPGGIPDEAANTAMSVAPTR